LGGIALALKALDYAFGTSGTRSAGPEKQGSKTTLEDWRSTQEEACKYLLECVNYLKAIAFNPNLDEESRVEAGRVFCRKIRILISSFGLFDEIHSDILRILKEYPNNNSTALTSLSHILKFDSESLQKETICKVKNLVAQLIKETEDNLDSEFATFISSPSYQAIDLFQGGEQLGFEESQKLLNKKSEEIALKFIHHPSKVFDSLEFFITGNHQNISFFGRALGKEFPEIDKLIEKSLAIYRDFPGSSPEFMGSLLNGVASNDLEKAESVLDSLLYHPSLSNHLSYITFYAAKASERNIDRIILSIKESIAPISSLKKSNVGSIIKDFPNKVEQLLNTLIETRLEGSIQACLGILASYSWEDRKKLIPFTPFILENFLSTEGLNEIRKSSDFFSDFYALNEILKFFFADNPTGLEMSLEFLNNLTGLHPDRSDRIHHNHGIEEILGAIFEKYGNEIWPTVRKLLIESDGLKTFFLSELFGSAFNDYDHPKKSPISKISWLTIENDIKNLDQKERNKICIFLIQSVNLLQKEGEEYKWNEWVKNIIHSYPESEILHAIKGNIFALSCWGGMSLYYKKYTASLQSLKNSEKPVLRNWASECLLMIEESIKHEENREEEFGIL